MQQIILHNLDFAPYYVIQEGGKSLPTTHDGEKTFKSLLLQMLTRK